MVLSIRYLLFAYASGLAFCAPNVVSAQVPRVFVREVHVDSILIAFGVEAEQVRAAVTRAISEAGRLTSASGGGPAIDVAITVPGKFAVEDYEPRASLDIEVGRNLMENGKAKSLVWERTIALGGVRFRDRDTPSYATWRALSDDIERQVLRIVDAFLSPR